MINTILYIYYIYIHIGQNFSNPFCHIVESHGLIGGTKATTDVHHAICMILSSPHDGVLIGPGLAWL